VGKSIGLAEALAQYHCGGERDIERAQTRLQRDAQPKVDSVVDGGGHPSAFAAE
jgi:hypothetical protein